MEHRGVPYSPWEHVASAWLIAVAVIWIVTASSIVQFAIGLAFLAFIVCGIVGSRRIHGTRPDLLAQRMPTVWIWVLGATALFMGTGVLVEQDLWSQVTDGLIALALIALVAADRTRPLPDQALVDAARARSGGKLKTS